ERRVELQLPAEHALEIVEAGEPLHQELARPVVGSWPLARRKRLAIHLGERRERERQHLVSALADLLDGLDDQELPDARDRVRATPHEIERPAAPRPDRDKGRERLGPLLRRIPRDREPHVRKPMRVELPHAEAVLGPAMELEPPGGDLAELVEPSVLVAPRLQ